MKKTLIAAALGMLAFPSLMWAAVYHVGSNTVGCQHGSAGCSDANTGLSRAAALCTLQAAINKLSYGSSDSIQLHTGTYNEDAEMPQGNNTGGASRSAPITLEGAPGDDPAGIILQGLPTEPGGSGSFPTSDKLDVAALRITGATAGSNKIKYIRVRNFTIWPALNRGIYVNKGSFVEIDNVTFTNWQGTGTNPRGTCDSNGSGGNCNFAAAISITGSDHVTVKNSNVNNGGTQLLGASGLQINSGNDDILVYNTHVSDFQGGCVHGSSNGGSSLATNPHGRIAYVNVDFRNCAGHTDEQSMIQSYNNQDTMLYGSLLVLPSNVLLRGGISCRRTSDCSNTSSCAVIGNTFVLTSGAGQVLGVSAEGPESITLRNNAFWGFGTAEDAYVRIQKLAVERVCGSCPTVCNPQQQTCSTFDEDYNYVYPKPPDVVNNGVSHPYAISNGIRNETDSGCTFVPGPHTVVTNANPIGLDSSYVPVAGSPLVNTGDPILGYPLGTLAPKDKGAFDLGAPGAFPQSFASIQVTSTSTPTIRWGGTANPGDIIVTPRNNPPITQAYYRVQIDTVPSFDSQGIWKALVDTNTGTDNAAMVASAATSYTVQTSLADGSYYVRVTLGDSTHQKEQEWSDPFYRFNVSSSRLPQTFYVDGDPSCPAAGTGVDPNCGVLGPKKTLAQGIALLSVSGDVLEVRGERQGSAFDGIYSSDYVPISNLDGGTDRYTIQPYHYLLPDQETVHIESTKPLVTTPNHGADGTGWTQCSWDGSACDCDPARLNVQVGEGTDISCGETWWHIKSGDGSQNVAAFAITPTDGITPLRGSLAGLTSQYDAFVDKRCSSTQTISCSVNSDCPGVETCLGHILVRWGSTLPSKPWVNYSSSANGFFISNSANLTIRGFDFRRIMRAALQIQSPNTNITVQRNKFHLNQDAGGGSARPITADSSTNIQVLDNELFYSQDEPLHMTTFTSGHFSGLIAGNWVHDIGAGLGTIPGGGGTPNCTTFTRDQNGNTTGDFSGLIVENNLFQRCRGVNGQVGILFESDCDGMIVRNNYLQDMGTCFKWAPDNWGGSEHTSNAQVYNNICETMTAAGGGKAACFHMNAETVGIIDGNVVANNTCIDPAGEGIVTDGNSTTGEVNNKFLNNLIFDDQAWDPSRRLIRWQSVVNSNTFKNNLLWAKNSSGGQFLASFGAGSPASFTCLTFAGNDVDGDAVADNNKCADPGWILPDDVAAHDFRLRGSSPAVDAGTMTGMPARGGINFTNPLGGPKCSANGAPCDIYGTCPNMDCIGCVPNVCVNPSGLPDYSAMSPGTIQSAPDIGAWEMLMKDGGFENSTTLDGPWIAELYDGGSTCPAAQNVTVGPMVGSHSLVLTAGPCLDSLCSGCRTPWVHQLVSNLDTGRRYTLSGRWSLISGTPGTGVRIDFGFRDPACLTSPFPFDCIIAATCSAQIGGSNTYFVCPSFLMPSGSTMDLIIMPHVDSGQGVAQFLIDQLDLR